MKSGKCSASHHYRKVKQLSDPATGNLATLNDVPEPVWLFVSKLVGAIAGSAVSLAYMLPQGKREAALRFATGMAAGLIFGTSVGLKLADELGVTHRLSASEVRLSGAALASLCAWWALGAIARLAKRQVHNLQN